jgi:hypothetical protein
MGKAPKLKASKSPRKAGMESSQAKRGRPRRKPAAGVTSEQSVASGDELEEPTASPPSLKAPARIVWDKYPERTERLLAFLDSHQDVAIKLFGDSTQTAKQEGRSKMTAKSNKGVAYLQVAEGIFSVDEDPAVRADFQANPSKYAKAVDNYITNT